MTRIAIRAEFAGCAQRWRILLALVAVLRERYRRRGYLRGPGNWVITDDTPRRYGPTESILRPSWGTSPIEAPPEAPPSPAPRPERPSRPDILQRA